jgi:hypothetical protein
MGQISALEAPGEYDRKPYPHYASALSPPALSFKAMAAIAAQEKVARDCGQMREVHPPDSSVWSGRPVKAARSRLRREPQEKRRG